jgi:hypothetical protein
VLEHIDDASFLERAKSMLAPDGRLIITVPAYMNLWSAHDVEHHHLRRYTKASLAKTLTTHGYRVEYASYWNMSLLIPAAILRFFDKTGEGGLTPPPLVNAILNIVLSIEAALIRIIPLPFGVSIVAVARRT